MSTKHLYVAAEDEQLWLDAAVAASLQGRSVSWVVHEALRRYLREIAFEDTGRA